MLFSLIGFETQTYTIICELSCNIIPLQLHVCDVYLLNHAILVVMLIYWGPSWHFYISESMRVSTC